jgi:hypothetical protein
MEGDRKMKSILERIENSQISEAYAESPEEKKFYADNPEYKALEKAVKYDNSEDDGKGAPVSKNTKGNDRILGTQEAYSLIKKGYVEKLTNSDSPDTSYYVVVTKKGKWAYGKMRQELMSIGYDD